MSYMKRPNNDGEYGGFQKRPRMAPAGPSKVLHLKGIPFDCNEGELQGIASPFGAVVRVLIVAQKKQGFIQMDSVESASKLLDNYTSQQATIRGHPLAMQFSSRAEITPNNRYPTSADPVGMEMKGFIETPPNTIVLVSILNMRLPVTLDNLHQVFRSFGDVVRIITFTKNNNFKALIEFQHLSSAVASKEQLNGKDIFQGCCTLRITYSSTVPPLRVKPGDPKSRDYTQPQMPVFQQPFGGPPQGFPAQQQDPYNPYGAPPPHAQGGFDPRGFAAQAQAAGGAGCVLLVNSLNESKIDCDKLFTLFGVYGDVMRVKILYNKKDTALVQLATPGQASLAKQHLDKIEIYGTQVAVSTSRHSEVSVPTGPQGSTDSGLTRDYSTSPLHRFKMPGSKNERHITAPSPQLHISNLPAGITEEELQAVFSPDGDLKGVRLFEAGNKQMAFANFGSISSSTEALIKLHNHKMREKNIRITFSHARDSKPKPDYSQGGFQPHQQQQQQYYQQQQDPGQMQQQQQQQFPGQEQQQ